MLFLRLPAALVHTTRWFRSQVKLTVETAYVPPSDTWFILNVDGGLIAGDDAGGCGAPAPSFWMHLSQEYFLAACRTHDTLLNQFGETCWGLSGCPLPVVSVSPTHHRQGNFSGMAACHL